MERVKTIAWWVVAALFLLWALAAFPSLGCLFFLIGAAVSAPVPAVRDFWDEKGLRGAPKVALAVALLIAGSVAAQDRFAERGEEPEPPSEAAEIAEAAPSADAESVPDEGETAPEAVEESAQSPESLVEFLDTQYSALGMENYEVAYEDGAFIIRLWEPGLTGIATRMANGGEDIPEDLTAEYESWTNTATSLSDSAHKLIKESGRNEDVRAYILNEWNHENVIFCAVNGVVSYDIAHGITW